MDGSNQPHEPVPTSDPQGDEQQLSTEAALLAEPVTEGEQQVEEAIDDSLGYTPQVEMPALVSPEEYTKDETLALAVDADLEAQKSTPLGAVTGLPRRLSQLADAQNEQRAVNESPSSTQVLRERAASYVEHKDAQVEEMLQEAVSPYEELYDLNPEFFSNLPTSEFMKLTKDYGVLKAEENFARYKFDVATRDLADFKEKHLRKPDSTENQQ